MNITKYTTHDGTELALYTWDNVTSPKAVVKICHGMAEHSARYDHFAQYLNSNGYIVVSNDHRAHGQTCGTDDLGYAEGDIFVNNAKDQIRLVDYCKDTYKLPVILFGHSYGSFITQYVMQEQSSAIGYVLSGSNYMKGLLISVGALLASNMCRNKGGRYPAKLLADMSFGAYEKKIPGKNNWLSRDPVVVANYSQDPMCGYVCSANFYRTFMKGAGLLYRKDRCVNIDLDKPLLIISGQCDPVGDYGKGVAKLSKFYQKLGMTNATTKLYEGARHELLNETNKDEVYAYIQQWLDGVIG